MLPIDLNVQNHHKSLPLNSLYLCLCSVYRPFSGLFYLVLWPPLEFHDQLQAKRSCHGNDDRLHRLTQALKHSRCNEVLNSLVVWAPGTSVEDRLIVYPPTPWGGARLEVCRAQNLRSCFKMCHFQRSFSSFAAAHISFLRHSKGDVREI